MEAHMDWYEGEDPGATVWLVTGADGIPITSTNNAWTLTVYDLSSSTPETALSASDIAHDSGTGSDIWFTQNATIQTDGYWSDGGTGYNWRAYLANASFTGTAAFIPGHEYRFVWAVTTPAYDDNANNWGTIVLVRTGRCLPKK